MTRPVFFMLLSLFLATSVVSAQAPQVTSVYPPAHKVDAGWEEAIRVSFDMPINPASITNLSFKVFGRWSGPASGEITLEDGGTTIVFTPSTSFSAGEWITVSLSKDIQSMVGMNISNGYSWNYWSATTPGPLVQPLVDVIELREPGEGLIQSYGAYAGDLNNDDYSDLTVVNETSDDLRILLNDGTGQYPSFTTTSMGNMTPSPNEGADFNNDGEIDLAVSTAHHNEVRILYGDGTGSFSNMQTYTTGDGARGLVILDCNADGLDDIFITNRLDDNISLLTNMGDDTFEVATLNTDGEGETSCAVADANNDGIPDIFIGMYDSRELGILLGNGDGTFELSDRIDVQGRPWMIAAGDINGDGNPDVVSANSSGDVTAVAFGNGAGELSEPTHYTPNNASFPLAIDLGDLDGDGDLDMVTSNYASATFTVYENDGDGAFSVANTMSAPDKASCAILHDRDGDGDLDISATDEGDDVILIFENQGMPSSTNNLADIGIRIQLSPNPFASQLNLEVALEKTENITLSILNNNGQLIQQLHSGNLGAGTHLFNWNGAAANGQTVAPGIYYLQSQIGDEAQLDKISFLGK